MSEDTKLGLPSQETVEELLDLAALETEEEKQEALSQDESLKVEFEQALKTEAEERARTPFFAAAQTHAMIWNGFGDSLRDVTSADLKRIILYLCGYPFYLKELGVEERKKNVIGVAYRASKLVEAKSAMILCKAIEQEARVAKALDEQEALIQPLNLEQPIESETADNTVEIKGE
jgi:hypothetical protein